MKLPPLRALPVFEAVARLNSFSLAAEELSVSQSAVSHQIKQLETYLGEKLFWRQGRTLTLTDEGRQYLDAVGSALLQIERASEQLLGREEARLRLSVFSSFAVRWLVPRLPELQRLHPQVELSLEMSTENPVLSDRVADCFITIHRNSPAYSYELLYVERLFPVCSQDYWQRMCRELGRAEGEDGALTPADVARFPLLSTHSIFERAAGDWQAWFQAAEQALPPDARLQHFSHMLLALEAARFHQGIALTNDYMLSSRKDSEDFVRLPCHPVVTGDRFYFAWKTSRRRERGIQILRRWLVDEARRSGLRNVGIDGGA
ncbi:LysR family transcriptional regulator [Marinobacter lutaoensis]|jgi:DNA-binding transcriptional LysR family regulator|uniref:LysR family transcriptional regulator n=1 Tax=Marinobacter lutaoensis TaxID=135739 RepID=A0A1V2DNL0_9GAMM|nr:LysR family transcriptional regulator [Marinobacter lutaoensis]MBE01747.1 LysR family transcriptional regulator [Marinobacter sp.]MBI43751.1 LysR family transcriptional regulator [Oceanospirillales bacterium]NVD35727.1 LysR family transcriptional regulator [Marinobacter lutaoensis]ONF42203.1 LysR family transcriptional regulator [Marinobacter lutaoensis]|tara:strand:- start:3127 stop:4080 length:954 start_codon:yes stop_codon:yes gene_type:complete